MNDLNDEHEVDHDEDDWDDHDHDDDDDRDYTAYTRADYDDTLEDDDPDAEFDAPPMAEETVEPSYKLANKLSFFDFAKKLEDISVMRSRSQQERLAYLLPPKLLHYFKPSDDPSKPPESIYPLLRLLMPGKDGHRGNFNVKEAKLARAYGEAFNLPETSREKLLRFVESTIVGEKGGVGKFDQVLEKEISKRLNSSEWFYSKFKEDRSKGFTVGRVNELLDQLAGLQAKAQEINEKLAAKGGDVKKKTSANKLLVEWVRKLNPYYESSSSNVLGLSPLEHKWLNRMILKGTLNIGLGDDTILHWYNPLGRSLWDAHNSLKGVCTKLVDPAFIDSLRKPQEATGDHHIGLHNFMTLPAQPVAFGVPFVPMCSAKITPATTLRVISESHRKFDELLVSTSPFKRALPLRNPAFIIETKLDGERMVVHYGRDGVTKIQSRKSNWFSDLYSPVLGPPLRKALGKHEFDIVLDGEILAYCGEKDGNQFGLNRTVAKKRREWMESRGMVDDRDKNVHGHDNEYKSMNAQSIMNFISPTFNATELDDSVSGENVWLTYVIFDVLYLEGPCAAEFLDETVSKCVSPRPVPGSIIDLSAMERKKILYRLVEIQDNMVEIVDTQVVRPNGELASGRDYFCFDNPMFDSDSCLPSTTLDALDCLFEGADDILQAVVAKRDEHADDELLSLKRAQQCDHIYRQTVDELCLEGIMFKNLSAAYILGEQGRALRYWLKMKPDYSEGSLVSDLDLVIVGGYFASGLAKAGTPSAFLVACRDSMDPGYYMPFCKVNAAVKGDVYKQFYDRTGCKEYTGNSQEEGNCKWFSSITQPPDFISTRSFQRSWEQSDFNGWKWDKSSYPHIWINPENSAIVTVKAGEIIRATSFPPGVTLRHPRIERFRNQALGDEKDLSTITCENQLRELYQEFQESRSRTFNTSVLSQGKPRALNANQPCMFLTEQQFNESNKQNRKRVGKPKRSLAVATVTETRSKALRGVTFVILDGIYNLNLSPTDCDLGLSEGWFDDASKVAKALDVSAFIKRHGGTVKLSSGPSDLVLGGRREDNKVVSLILGVNEAREAIAKEKPSAARQTQKSAKQHEKAKQSGVIRWTFVYSAVYRWQQTVHDPDASIVNTRPELLQPHLLDYLMRPQESCESELAELCGMDITNEIQLRRALDAVGMICNNGDVKRLRLSWQEEAMTGLDEDERWVVRSGTEANDKDMVVFPDIFSLDENGAFATRESLDGAMSANFLAQQHTHLRPNSDTVTAVLPLARTMGAFVTPHISPRVTHIVCDLLEDTASEGGYEYTSNQVKADQFCNVEVARALLGQVRDVERENDVTLKLISASWMRRRRREWL
ncbi:hypothetical protein MPSEU_000851100 [Mayamaea pseudoterrestris]|nr:hypothetical protein MPSEU_000851100 [Mayamaea pseudoterrestris]